MLFKRFECRHCGNPFKPVHPLEVYCRQECRRLAQLFRMSPNRLDNQMARLDKKLARDWQRIGCCENCGVTITRKTKRSKYCSRRCSVHAHYIRQTDRTPIPCKTCNEPVLHGDRNTRYCSNVCRVTARVAQQRRRRGQQAKLSKAA